MRRIRNVAVALLLAALLLSLGGCQKEVPAPPDGPVTELAYPGTYWTMSPDQLREALSLPADGLPEELTPADAETGETSQYRFGVKEWECFGANGSATFIFGEDLAGPGTYDLRIVQIVLDAGADTQAVLDALTAQYGQPAQSNGKAARWESKSRSRDYLEEDVSAQLEALFPEEYSLFSPGGPLATIDFYIDDSENNSGVLIFTGRHTTIQNLAQTYVLSDG